METKQRTCSNCMWTEKITDPNNIGQVSYICRCMPPSPIAIVTQQGVAVQSFHPHVTADSYCGQWKGKVSLPNSSSKPSS